MSVRDAMLWLDTRLIGEHLARHPSADVEPLIQKRVALWSPGFGPPKHPDWPPEQCHAYADDLRALLTVGEGADE